MPIFTIIGSLVGAQLMAIMVKFFQTIEVLGALSQLNAEFGKYVPFINDVFNAFTLPGVLPEDFLIKNIVDKSSKARVKTTVNITENNENIFIISLKPLLVASYFLTWAIYGLGSLVRWFGFVKIQRLTVYIRDTLFGIGIFDLVFTAVIEISENKKGLENIFSIEGISLCASCFSLMLISFNLALLISQAAILRKKIKMRVFRNIKTKERHYIVEGVSDYDKGRAEVLYGDVDLRYVKKNTFLCNYNNFSLVRFLIFQVAIVNFQSMNRFQCFIVFFPQLLIYIYYIYSLSLNRFIQSKITLLKLTIFETVVTIFLFFSLLLAWEKTSQIISGYLGEERLEALQITQAALIGFCLSIELIYLLYSIGGLLVYVFNYFCRPKSLVEAETDYANDPDFEELKPPPPPPKKIIPKMKDNVLKRNTFISSSKQRRGTLYWKKLLNGELGVEKEEAAKMQADFIKKRKLESFSSKKNSLVGQSPSSGKMAIINRKINPFKKQLGPKKVKNRNGLYQKRT